MHHRMLPSGATRVVLAAILTIAGHLAWSQVPPGVVAQAGQDPTTATGALPKARVFVPQTASGVPDVTGVWNYSTMTPFERPATLADKPVFQTDEEAAAFALRELARSSFDSRSANAAADSARGYNEFWMERGGNVLRQTSLVIDPPDGRLPPMTPEGKGRLAASSRKTAIGTPAAPTADSYEELNTRTRCLPLGLPHDVRLYNNNVEIIQSASHVAIVKEMVHEAQIVPLDRRPHLPPHLLQWLGDSRGRWEGETLIIETTNFNGKTEFRGASENLRLTERYRRLDADTLEYEYTVDDPATWTRPWTARLQMTRLDEPIYEYACHEGNRGVAGVLGGIRATENAAPASDDTSTLKKR